MSDLSLQEFTESADLAISPASPPTPLSPSPRTRPHQPSSSNPELSDPLPVDYPKTPRTPRSRSRALQQSKNLNRGHWTTLQNKKYHWFLEMHYQHFVNRHMRRMDKIFKTMEQFIGTRQAEQCRSHHQKMEKKYLNFVAIINNLRKMHYGTYELEPMLIEIAAEGVELAEPLATLEELAEQQTLPVNASPKERKKSQSLRQDRSFTSNFQLMDEPMEAPHIAMEEEKQSDMQFQRVNMLQESHLNNIGYLSLMHEKDSGLFQNIFEHD